MRSIEELEGDAWPDPGPGSSGLIRHCTALRRKPVDAFTVEDMRIMIGQRIGLALLIPRAVSVLVHDPLAEGDHYPGDLLCAVVGLPFHAWIAFGEERQRLVHALADTDWAAADADVRAAVRGFMADIAD
jgi:hypothetical protein